MDIQNVKQILVLCLVVNIYTVRAQKMDSINIANADKVLCQYFKNCLANETYVIYNIGDKYIIVTRNSRYYKLHFVTLNSGLEKTIRVKKNHKVLQLAFKSESCHRMLSQGFPRQAHPHSRYLYYRMQKDGRKMCEFNLPIIFSDDVTNKIVYPLNDQVNEYLSQELLRHWY